MVEMFGRRMLRREWGMDITLEWGEPL